MTSRGQGAAAFACAAVIALTGCGSDKQDATPPETIGAAQTIPGANDADPTLRQTESAGTGDSTAGATSAGTSSGDATPAATTTGAAAGAPVMPAVAKTNTKAGAEAFARWYFEMINYLGKSGKGSYPPVALPSCKSCATHASRVSMWRDESLRLSGDRYRIESVSSFPSGGDWFVDLRGRELIVDLIGPDGKVRARSTASPGTSQPQLRWAGAEWRIVEIRAQVAQ